MFNWFNKSKVSKQKLKKLKEALKQVEMLAIEHLELNDSKINALPELELLLGVMQFCYENVYLKALKEYKETGKLPEGELGNVVKESLKVKEQISGMFEQKQQMYTTNIKQAEQDFEKPEFNITKKVVH